MTLVTWRVTPNTEQSKPVQKLYKRLKAGGTVALSDMTKNSLRGN